MNDPMLVGAIGVFVVMVLFGITEQLLLWHARRADGMAARSTSDAATGLDQAHAAPDAAKEAISNARESLTAGH